MMLHDDLQVKTEKEKRRTEKLKWRIWKYKNIVDRYCCSKTQDYTLKRSHTHWKTNLNLKKQNKLPKTNYILKCADLVFVILIFGLF